MHKAKINVYCGIYDENNAATRQSVSASTRPRQMNGRSTNGSETGLPSAQTGASVSGDRHTMFVCGVCVLLMSCYANEQCSGSGNAALSLLNTP